MVVIKKIVPLHGEKTIRRPVRLVGLGRKIFILEIRGSNPLRGTSKIEKELWQITKVHKKEFVQAKEKE